MEIRQSQKQTQQLMLTQAMRQSLHILQMPLLELREYVTEAAAENPLLEVDCPEGEVALEPEPEEAFEPDNPHNPEDFFLSAEYWSAGGTRRRAEEGTSLDAGVLADHSAREEKLSDVLNEQLLGLGLPEDTVEKQVHWYLMMGESYYSKPQREEYFTDSGYYKYHEAYHLLKFSNEKQILEKAYNEYLDLKKSNLWGNHKYY